MTRIIGGLLVRNEAHRWLNNFLELFKMMCDKIVILDDASTDNTAKICENYGTVYQSMESYWSTREWMQRETLFNLCCNAANLNDWIIILDADELVNNPYAIRNNLLCDVDNHNAYVLRLFDMWSTTEYRSDQYWTAHNRYWPIALRKLEIEYVWDKINFHCYRLPKSAMTDFLYDDENYIKHMGWSTEKDRIKKYNRYMEIDGEGKYGWLDQYKSILDKNPNLIKLEENKNE